MTDYPIVRRLREGMGTSTSASHEAADLIEEMAAALGPMAKEAEQLDYPDVPDNHAMFMSDITMGDLRRAVATLKKLRGE